MHCVGAGVSGLSAEPATGSSSSSTAPEEVKVTGNLHTLFTGIVFGLQPDALFVIVPALALPTKLAATAYILMFVFGTVAAMGSYTAFIGLLAQPLQIVTGQSTMYLAQAISLVIHQRLHFMQIWIFVTPSDCAPMKSWWCLLIFCMTLWAAMSIECCNDPIMR